MKTITVDWLQRVGACGDGERFFKINKLDGFPIDMMPMIVGDYHNYLSWLRTTLNIKHEFDVSGRLVYRENSGVIIRYFYNENGDLVHRESFNGNSVLNVWYEYEGRNLIRYKDDIGEGTEYTQTFSEDGRIVDYVDSYGYKNHKEFDARGNCIYMIDDKEFEYWAKYDTNNNQTWYKNSKGAEYHNFYDERNLLVEHRSVSGYREFYEYDGVGNLTCMYDNKGYKKTYEVEYYWDGQLKRIGRLELPWFSKEN